ncbi:MAG: UV DNA damage repair endonuclease UvsE [Clostridium sp.]|uniref:UV DNA damage repair endonuclease UvsE n=1 Tax=Clostridium sp. TaxID=1506 RepID=UPI0030577CE6
MINRIGYACINTSLNDNFRDCRLNSVYKQGIPYLKDIIIHNLNLTKNTLLWNIDNDIFFYRATSKLVPFATHKEVLRDFSFRWYEDENALKILAEIKEIVHENNVRLSMHPDQFTILNSLREDVVLNSIDNLIYHKDILEYMGGSDLIIHTGGVYGDKLASIERFISNFNKLPKDIKKYLRLENDDVSYNLKDVLDISKTCGIPVVLDIHHHNCNNCGINTVNPFIYDVSNSWKKTGLIPKCHISSGITTYTDKRHADYISPSDFFSFCEITEPLIVDLMVEAKRKEQAVLMLKTLIPM